MKIGQIGQRLAKAEPSGTGEARNRISSIETKCRTSAAKREKKGKRQVTDGRKKDEDKKARERERRVQSIE